MRLLLRCTSLLLALSGGSQGGEFTSAFGGVAEVHGRTASASFDANDPNRSIGAPFCCAAQPACCCARLRSAAQGEPGDTASDHEP
jgi:hypothetical protein